MLRNRLRWKEKEEQDYNTWKMNGHITLSPWVRALRAGEQLALSAADALFASRYFPKMWFKCCKLWLFSTVFHWEAQKGASPVTDLSLQESIKVELAAKSMFLNSAGKRPFQKTVWMQKKTKNKRAVRIGASATSKDWTHEHQRETASILEKQVP